MKSVNIKVSNIGLEKRIICMHCNAAYDEIKQQCCSNRCKINKPKLQVFVHGDWPAGGWND